MAPCQIQKTSLAFDPVTRWDLSHKECDPLRPTSQRMWPAETYLTKNVTHWDPSHTECDPRSPISQRMWPAETYLTKNVTRWDLPHKECDLLRPISRRMWPTEIHLTQNVTRGVPSHKECDPLRPISQRMWPAETHLTKKGPQKRTAKTPRQLKIEDKGKSSWLVVHVLPGMKDRKDGWPSFILAAPKQVSRQLEMTLSLTERLVCWIRAKACGPTWGWIWYCHKKSHASRARRSKGDHSRLPLVARITSYFPWLQAGG